MTRYLFDLRDLIFVKGYWFLSFIRNIVKNVREIINKKLSSKYSQRLLYHAKKSATYALKAASKREIQKTAEASGDLIKSKIADKITRISKISPKINSETNEEEIFREKYISPELRQKSIDDLRLKEENYWWLSSDNIIITNMEYQKIINLLDNATSEPFKFRTGNWVEISLK